MYSALLLVLLALAAMLFFNGLKAKNRLKMFLGIIIAIFSLGFFWFMGFWGEALWFSALGYKSRFWLEIIYSIIFAILGAVIAFGSLYLLTIYLPKDTKYVKWTSIPIGILL
jgi:ABC-type Fe3+ transport system permease subunit